ncbi:MAG TPA: MarR family transcriptional regulator [Stellaceae bacterium]|nr:MarR family transcriptional regulator [Stellaceae bacterium]
MTADRRELLIALNRAMRDASGQGVLYSQAVAARLGVNSTDLECLDFIVMRGAITAGELATLTGLTTGAITGVIDRLEQAGFARRERDGSDRRKVLVRPLPAVAHRIVPLFEPMERAASDALADFSEKELTLLLDFLRRARNAAVDAMKTLHAQVEPRKKRRSRKRSRA